LLDLRWRVGTPARILDAALAAFGTRGFEAVSLDSLARDLGVRKQTILHHFGSKDALLGAVVDRCATDLALAIDGALDRAGTDGRRQVEAVVKAVFRLGARHPELLGFIREVSRLGPPASDRLTEALNRLVGRIGPALGRHDTRTVLLGAYSAVIGAATEVEVLGALGERPTARTVLRRRHELLGRLEDAL
jgi:TetR/AcrR family transcriptional regulator